jgi:hypothetical protein
MTVDLLGKPMLRSEERLVAVYEELKELSYEELSPSAHANVVAALALMHNAVNSLALKFEQLGDLGE